MATELVQQQSMRQEQTMTHHQIQALKCYSHLLWNFPVSYLEK